MSNQTKDDLVDNTQQKDMEAIQSNNEQPAQEDIKQEDLEANQSNNEQPAQEEAKQEQLAVDTDTDDDVESEGYEREDSDEGIITNIPEITQQQATHITDVIYNGMLGDYDEHGKYDISKDIIKELTHMPKRFVRKDKFGTYLQSKYGDTTFNFCLTPPVIKENGDAYCYLQLLEEVSYTNGYIIDTKTTTLATYEYTYSDVYYDWVASAFNIDQDPGGEPEGGREYKMPDYINLRLKYLKAVADMSIDQFEQLDEEYFNKRLQILNEIPEGTIILAEFSKERAKIEHYFLMNSRRKFKALNDLLNSILDGMAGERIKQNAEYNRKMAEVNIEYLNKVNSTHQNALNSAEVQKILEEEQPIKKINFEDDLPKNVTQGAKYSPKKASKSKKPSVPKPDKYKSPKKKKPGKKDKKDSNSSIGLDWDSYFDDVYHNKDKYGLNKSGKKPPEPTSEDVFDVIFHR